MPLVPRYSIALLAFVALASAGQAQDANALVAPPAASVSAPMLPVAGPRLDAVRSGVPVVSTIAATALEPAPMRKADSPRSRMLMIVGGAALLGGAIIGDDVGTIIMLGGLGVGIYGLYLFLQ